MKRPWARRHAVLALLIAGLALLNPFVWASTADFFLEGIHDAEADDVLQAVVSLKDVAHDIPILPRGHSLSVVAVVTLTDDASCAPSCRSALPSRAPPLV